MLISDCMGMLVLAGGSRSLSLLLQWFKLEHCRCWQDSHPVWPELSDHPAASSLRYTTLLTSIHLLFTISQVSACVLWDGLHYMAASQISQSKKFLRWLAGRFVKAKSVWDTVKVQSHVRFQFMCFPSTQFDLSQLLLYVNTRIPFFRNWCGCHWCMPGWAVFGGLWKKWKPSFDLCSTQENPSHQGRCFFLIYFIISSSWGLIKCYTFAFVFVKRTRGMTPAVIILHNCVSFFWNELELHLCTVH